MNLTFKTPRPKSAMPNIPRGACALDYPPFIGEIQAYTDLYNRWLVARRDHPEFNESPPVAPSFLTQDRILLINNRLYRDLYRTI